MPTASNVQPLVTSNLVNVNGGQTASGPLPDPPNASATDPLGLNFPSLITPLREIGRKQREILQASDAVIFNNRREDDIQRLAAKWGEKPEKMRERVNNDTRFTKQRAPSAWNAFLHLKAESGEITDPESLREATKALRDEYDQLSQKERKLLVEQLAEHRVSNTTGVARTAVQATRESKRVLAGVHEALGNLNDSAHTVSVLFHTRGRKSDGITPTVFATDLPGTNGTSAGDFFMEKFNISTLEIAEMIEQWAFVKINLLKKQKPPSPVDLLRGKLAKELEDSLNSCFADMNGDEDEADPPRPNYEQYDEFVATHGIWLVGWPDDLECRPQSPWRISGMARLRVLQEAITDKKTYWAVMTKEERAAHAADMVQRQRAGELIVKTRKTRSDKGTTRKRKRGEGHDDDQDHHEPHTQDNKDEDEEHRSLAAKKTKKTKVNAKAKATVPASRPVRSRSVIDDSDAEAGDN